MLTSERSTLAAIAYERGHDVDRLLLDVCAELRSLGMRIGGVVQRSVGDTGSCATSVDVVDLQTGQTFDIWENRGTCARGCRLDERGLLDAEPAILTAIGEGVDLVVINRFGRAESLGRGLIDSLRAALDAGIPVLTAVRPPYTEAWSTFHGGIAQSLGADSDEILRWCVSKPARSTASMQ